MNGDNPQFSEAYYICVLYRRVMHTRSYPDNV